jgi:peroxiredoxin
MSIVLLLARLLLAGIFALAAIAKLVDRSDSRKISLEFGLPVWLAPLVALLPLVELLIAASLLSTITTWWGSVAGMILLLVFISTISANLMRGNRPTCNCFGQLRSAPVGQVTLYRNGLFAVLAGFIIWHGKDDPGLSILQTLNNLPGDQLVFFLVAVVFLVLSVIEGWLIFHLLRQHGRLLLKIDNLDLRLNAANIPPVPDVHRTPAGLPAGSSAPGFSLPLLSGGTLSLDALRERRRPVVLIFSDPHCGPCNELLPEVATWEAKYAGRITIALVSRGTTGDNRAKITKYGLKHVLIQRDNEVAEMYRALATPSAAVVQSDGTIGASLAIGSQAITELVLQAVRITASVSPVPHVIKSAEVRL